VPQKCRDLSIIDRDDRGVLPVGVKLFFSDNHIVTTIMPFNKEGREEYNIEEVVFLRGSLPALAPNGLCGPELCSRFQKKKQLRQRDTVLIDNSNLCIYILDAPLRIDSIEYDDRRIIGHI